MNLGEQAVDQLQADYDRRLARLDAMLRAGDVLADEAGRMAADDPFRDRARLTRAVKDWYSVR